MQLKEIFERESKRNTVADCRIKIMMPNKGVYVVKIGDNAVKVAL